MSPTEVRPMISAEHGGVIPDLTIAGSRAPFTVLPPAAAQPRGPVHTVFREGLLREPLEDYVARDPAPLPVTADREGYHGDRHFDWWCSGLRDFLEVVDVAERWEAGLVDGARLLELGCASGRVLRHFAAHRPGLDLWGADISLRHVEWMRLHLPPAIGIFQNTTLPHLPIEDDSCAVVCAFSVFTHIDELELAWIAEIRRILRPGGIAFLTIHSDHTWREMRPGWPIHDALVQMRDKIADYAISPELLRGPLPAEKTVFRWSSAKNYNTNVFHTADYIRSAWGRLMPVCEIIRGGHSYQDVVVLRKPARRPSNELVSKETGSVASARSSSPSP